MSGVAAGSAYTAPAKVEIAKPSIVQKFADKPKDAKVNPSFDIIGSNEFLNLFSNHNFRFLNKVVFYKFAILLLFSISIILSILNTDLESNILTCCKLNRNVLITSILTYY